MVQKSVVSEEDLKTFCERYIPSARAAFKHAADLSEHEAYLDGKISSLEAKDIIRAMNDYSVACDAHQIFVLRPGPSRSIPLVQIATDFLTRKLFLALGPKLSNSAEELSSVFKRNKITKSVAGALLNSVLENQFSKSGYWPIHKLKASRKRGRHNQHFKMDSSSTQEYLIINGLNRPSFSISDTPPAEGVVHAKVQINFFSSTGTIKLVDGYYIPISSNQATSDSFYYDATHRQATILQFTTSDMEVEGLKQLQELGVHSIRYVAVTGPQQTFDLPVPHDYANFVSEMYLLILEKI